MSLLHHPPFVFAPPSGASERARTGDALASDFDALRERAARDPLAYWGEEAERFEWVEPWHTLHSWSPEEPRATWFEGARLNITLNALDRHARGERADKLALIWAAEPDPGEPSGEPDERRFTYAELSRRVNQTANALRSLGVGRGDRVTIYMALTPELPITMLACARIGAIHCVVYAGFSAPALRGRIEDSGSRLVVATDIGFRRGKRVPLRSIVAEATRGLDAVEQILLLRRDASGPELAANERDWTALVDAQSPECQAEIVEAEAPLFYLYTSGTTGKPKGICHVHGGYMVGTAATHRIAFDVGDDDIYFCTADPGWITGHSYVVYAPLLNGTTVLLAEGALDWPDGARWWRLIERYGVTIFYTTPTAIRALMRGGNELPDRHAMPSLRVLGSVGEPINPEAWLWLHAHVGKARCALIDTWWQTETGQFLISTVPSYPAKPGHPGKPYPGIEAAIVDRQGRECEPGEQGFLVIKNQWPAMMRTIFGDHERYASYWRQIPPFYTVGDAAVRDEDGFIRVIGRTDDVMNVAGYRIGTADVESALVSHPSVAEAAVIGLPDEIKGERIKAFVILRAGHEPSSELAAGLQAHVRAELSPIAVPAALDFVASLPKTRSGKIMRRVLKAREMGVEPGDLSTLED